MTYDGLLVHQRPDPAALPLFVFAAPASEILSWSRILETAKVKGAAQRLESPGHIKSIRSYIKAATVNIIPPSVTLALQADAFSLVGGPKHHPDKPGVVLVKLTVKPPKSGADADKPAFVIDGQHRLKAIAEEDPAMPVVAAVILGASQLERALNFIVINNKAKRVSGDLVRGIVAELQQGDQDLLGARLEAVGLTLGDYPTALGVLGRNPDSPFRDMIDWDINRGPAANRRIKPQALESSLREILANLQAPDKLDIDEAVELLSAMWRGVAAAWTHPDKPWHHEESKLADKAGLVAVTEFLVERLNTKREEGLDVSDPAQVEEYSRLIMSTVLPDFWLSEWNEKGLDTSAGRNLIRQSLAALRTAVSTKHAAPLTKVPLLRPTSGE
jgi:DGQHR domain-containing protein